MRRSSLWIALILGLLAQRALAEDAFMKLRPRVEVDDVVVKLGDVAEVTARQAVLADQLKRVEVGRFATLSRPIRLNRSDIERVLEQSALVSSGSVVWGGASEVQLVGRSRRIDLTAGVDAAASALMARLGTRQYIEIRVLDDGGDVVGPPGKTRIVPEIELARRRGYVIEVPLLVEIDGIAVAHPLVRFEVTRKPPEFANASLLPAVPTAQVSLDEKVEEPVNWAVQKDHPIRVIVAAGAVRLESSGIALADARQGDKVMIRRLGGGTDLQGRATGRDLVVVEEN